MADEQQEKIEYFYRIRFREEGQEFTASSLLNDLSKGEVVMVRSEHGLEPATIICSAPACRDAEEVRKASYEIPRRGAHEECNRYANIPVEEASAESICKDLIANHGLKMHLVRVERFFNGSKMIFYFTADKRVDFRGLVKDLVQEFRTRVEMRQVGVRHETKMIGGLGTCGRELCCAGFMKKFDSVSIKMAKEQDLPLNPSKISGVCNRLLCCLTYEYETYKRERKGMPRPGRKLMLDGHCYRVKRQNPLQSSLQVLDEEGEMQVLKEEQWKRAEVVKAEKKVKKVGKEKKKTEKKDKGGND
ncbi:MAG: regulatory iron-sulfur-containing complex subunit RicT [Thermodesulfobacteriota bacterium]